MSCIKVRYEKQLTTPSALWAEKRIKNEFLIKMFLIWNGN